MKYEELIAEELEELRALEKKQKLVQFEKRVRFLMALKSGAAKTQKAAGSQVGWQVRQSQKIWQRYRERGLAGVLEKSERRGFGKLSSVEISQLNEYLREFGAQSLAEIQSYLETTCGVSYTIGGVSDLCIRLQIKLKTARPSNYAKDERAVSRYKKTSLRSEAGIGTKTSNLKMRCGLERAPH
jgi:transposase